ncbi:BufA1 family periplasmic bufferin-type metallophore [Pelagibius marinus]|uniref:BufA1 family periplasmic bufferin-type metallophore n=1 Tax=Pelagibius marinus TaxID=2762760 RepID=UPI0018731B7D|nr:DUF2282 domain-containing protein [Pelagibius marinus]
MKTTHVLMSAVALSFTLSACASNEGKPAAQQSAVEKCFGVAKAGANDCKAGSHDCAGHSTVDGDPASFVVLPAGTCDKIAGGSLG